MSQTHDSRNQSDVNDVCPGIEQDVTNSGARFCVTLWALYKALYGQNNEEHRMDSRNQASWAYFLYFVQTCNILSPCDFILRYFKSLIFDRFLESWVWNSCGLNKGNNDCVDHISKHLEACRKCSSVRRISNSVFSIWKCSYSQTRAFVFDMLPAALFYGYLRSKKVKKSDAP